MKRAFTLIELLVVIAVISVIAAILFPVFSRAREMGRRTSCLAHERQLGMAIMQYLQDGDETYPYSYAPGDPVIWPRRIAPYTGIAAAGTLPALSCPDAPESRITYSANGQVVGLLGNPATDGPNFYPDVVRGAAIESPATIVLLGDGSLKNDDTREAAAEFAYPHPALRKDDTNDADDWTAPWNGVAINNNKQIAWRHSSGANFTYVDGHARWVRFGGLTDADWDVRCQPGIGCSNIHDPAYYPAASASCDGQSALNCQ